MNPQEIGRDKENPKCLAARKALNSDKVVK